MATKRKIKDDDDDWVVRKLSPDAPRLRALRAKRLRGARPRISRPVTVSPFNRNELVQALLAEIELGNSMTKLYATMLAREILNSDPKLARKYRGQLEAAQE
jgi:hypothetical protein